MGRRTRTMTSCWRSSRTLLAMPMMRRPARSRRRPTRQKVSKRRRALVRACIVVLQSQCTLFFMDLSAKVLHALQASRSWMAMTPRWRQHQGLVMVRLCHRQETRPDQQALPPDQPRCAATLLIRQSQGEGCCVSRAEGLCVSGGQLCALCLSPTWCLSYAKSPTPCALSRTHYACTPPAQLDGAHILALCALPRAEGVHPASHATGAHIPDGAERSGPAHGGWQRHRPHREASAHA
jgi:hypothetical protein